MKTRKASKRASKGSPDIETKDVFDVFQPGLVRGEASFKHKPEKKVFYVQHPTEGWRVFLRAVCFIHQEGKPDRFIVLKKTGMAADANAWEAPKGQMEGKDGLAHPNWSILKLLEQNIRRETKEEAKISKFISLEHLPSLIVQAKESEYEAFKAQLLTPPAVTVSGKGMFSGSRPAIEPPLRDEDSNDSSIDPADPSVSRA